MMNRSAFLAGLLAMLVSLLPSAQQPASAQRNVSNERPRFSVSRETTFVTGPLRPDGSVNFAAAINARWSKGVTAENNACVLLYSAFGPKPEGTEMPLEFFELLQMEPPPVQGEYLRTLDEMADSRDLSDEQQKRLFEHQTRAISHPWTRDELPQIAAWVDQNEEPLRKVHAAVQRDVYFSPLVVDYGDTDGPGPLVAALLPGVAESRSAARLLCVRAMLHLGQGESEAAWKDLLASHRLGRLVGMGPTVIEGLVGYAIEGMTYEADVTFIQKTGPTSAEARRYREALAAMPPISPISEKVHWTERCMCLDALLVMAWNRTDAVELLAVEDGLAAVGKIINMFGLRSIDWDLALRTSNDWYDRVVASFDLPTYEERRRAFAQIHEELQMLGARIKDADSLLRDIRSGTDRQTAISRTIGDVVAAILLPKLDRARIAEDRVRQRAENLDVALALAAFDDEHGRYPANLGELVPEYLDHSPIDLFSGKTPIYRQRDDRGYLLYSVGENARDDQGYAAEDDPSGDDLAVEVGSPQP